MLRDHLKATARYSCLHSINLKARKHSGTRALMYSAKHLNKSLVYSCAMDLLLIVVSSMTPTLVKM